jgi:hypothetical protein
LHKKDIDESIIILKFSKNPKKIILMDIFLIFVVIIPRLPVFLVNNIIGSDTWIITSLAQKIVVEGDLRFLINFLSFFELIPFSKAIIAPLYLSFGGFASGLIIIDFQYYLVLLLCIIGISIFRTSIYQILDLFAKTTINHSRNDYHLEYKKIIISYIASSIFFSIPILVAQSDGFISGRTFFYCLTPIFLYFLFGVYETFIYLNQKSFTQIIKLLLSFTILTLAHRMSLLITIPLLFPFFLLTFFKFMKKKNYGKVIFRKIKKIDYRNLILFLSVIDLFIFLIRAILYELIGFTAWTSWYMDENRFFKYLSDFPLLGNLIFSSPHLSLILTFLITFGLFFIFIFVIKILFFILYKKYSNQLQNEKFFQILIILTFPLIPNVFFIHHGPYFSLSILVIYTIISSIFFYFLLITLNLNNKFFKIIRIKKIFNKIIDVNKNRMILSFFMLIIVSQSFISESIVVNSAISDPEYSKSYISEELRSVSEFVNQQEIYGNILISSSNIAVKLSTMVPSFDIFPSYYQYMPYLSQFNISGYKCEFRELKYGGFSDIISYLRSPFAIPEEYLNIANEIDILLNGSLQGDLHRSILNKYELRFFILLNGQDLENYQLFEEIILNYSSNIVFENEKYTVYDFHTLFFD